MLLCDFHIHTTWSDGSVPLREMKDFFAEDYTLGAMFKRAGSKVLISGHAMDAEAAG